MYSTNLPVSHMGHQNCQHWHKIDLFLCFSLEAHIFPVFQEMVSGRIFHVFDHWVVCTSCKTTWLMVWDNIFISVLLFSFSQMISLLAQAGLLRDYLMLMIHSAIRDSVLFLWMAAKLTQTIALLVQWFPHHLRNRRILSKFNIG